MELLNDRDGLSKVIFSKETSANDTTRSKYIWELKETSNANPNRVWSIAKKVPPY